MKFSELIPCNKINQCKISLIPIKLRLNFSKYKKNIRLKGITKIFVICHALPEFFNYA